MEFATPGQGRAQFDPAVARQRDVPHVGNTGLQQHRHQARALLAQVRLQGVQVLEQPLFALLGQAFGVEFTQQYAR